MKKNLYLLYELIDREFEQIIAILGAKKILDVSYDRNFFRQYFKFDPGIVIYKSVAK